VKMKSWTLAVSLTAALGGLAGAQPLGNPDDPPQPPVGGDPLNPQPQPVPDPNAQPQPNPDPQPTTTSAPTEPAEADTDGDRPEGIAIGIGGGWLIPGPIDMFTTYSVRLRLPTGIIIEPIARLQNNTTSPAVGDDSSSTTIELGALVQAPVVKRGKFDLTLIGGASFDTQTTPAPMDETNRVTHFNLDWGVGVHWWISPHFALSALATNPIVRFTRSSNSGSDETESQRDLGLVFDPQVALMIHIFN